LTKTEAGVLIKEQYSEKGVSIIQLNILERISLCGKEKDV
jgi:hypothetical protein